MRNFSITMTASPFTSDQHERAQRFVGAAIDQGHTVSQVFFYQDAVLAASPGTAIAAHWAELAQQAGCALFVCVSAAERRGLTDAKPPWEIVGLGDWVAGLEADHALHFGD